ncbi:MAG: hypothetical protein PHX51_08355 [Clostridia bacterium]|nr:hypothetical protein [Clostridia bacterium]
MSNLNLDEAMGIVSSLKYKMASATERVILMRETLATHFIAYKPAHEKIIRYYLEKMIVDELTALYFGYPPRLLAYVLLQDIHGDFLSRVISYFLTVDEIVDANMKEAVLEYLIAVEENLYKSKLNVYKENEDIAVDILHWIYNMKRTLRGERGK